MRSAFSIFLRLLKGLIKTKATTEDTRRRGRILNILLLATFVLSASATLVVVCDSTSLGLPVEIVGAISLIFLALYFFARAGKTRLVAYVFVLLYFFPAAYVSYFWSVDVPQAMLIYALVIVMSGILVSTRFAFVLTALASGFLIILTYLQNIGYLQPSAHWTSLPLQLYDSIIYSLTLGIIAVVSWLFNREIEKALKRARRSEKALKKERDLLEVKVEERTKELKTVQMEKARQLYRMADFGRIAAGLFHDLVNPLTTVSLHLDQLQEKGVGVGRKKLNRNTEKMIRRAVRGTDQMKKFVKMVRKQIQEQRTEDYYFLNNETAHTIEMIEYRAKELDVKLDFVSTDKIRTYGNSYRYNQLVSNLACNAIESYEGLKERKNRKVVIDLSEKNGKAILVVQDFGCGIPKKNLKKIFDPFFTTKSAEKGIGIGLSICKGIVEKELNGKIGVKSKEGEGTIFKVEFSINKKLIK